MEESPAQKLLREMDAKYGKTAPAPAPVVAPPVQQPVAVPAQQGSTIGGAVNALRGRAAQIDKAAGYACGGNVKAHAQGGKIMGPGTSTSDSIPGKVKETGEPILVSNNERIVSSKQEQLLERIAQMLGFETVDQMFEQMTGTPVGPTMKGGKMAAEDGLSPEEKKRRIESGNIAGPVWFGGDGSRPTVGLPNNGDEYGKAVNSVPSVAGQMFPNTARTWNEAGKDVGAAMNAGNYANAFGNATRGALATGAGVIDDVVGNPIRAITPSVKDAWAGLTGNVNPAQPKPVDQKPAPSVVQQLAATPQVPAEQTTQQSPLVTGVQRPIDVSMNNGIKTFDNTAGKGVSDDSASALIDQKNSTYNPQRQYENMVRLRLMSDATNPEITDPVVRKQAQEGLVLMDRNTTANALDRRTRAEAEHMGAQNSLLNTQVASANQLEGIRQKAINGDKEALALYQSLSQKHGDDNKPWAHVVGGGVNPDTGMMNPQYLVTGRGDRVSSSVTGSEIAKRGQASYPKGHVVTDKSGAKWSYKGTGDVNDQKNWEKV